jgi:O-succinylbenzoate synthase
MSASPIYVYEYLLRSGVALNAASHRRIFPGALIRVGAGYGCIHPWTEFGDAPIEEQLRRLAEGITTPVTEMALRCAEIDGAAREAGISLFADLEIPRSHYSWSFAQPTGPQIERIVSEGWPALKAKGFANYGETRGFLEQCAKVGEATGLKLRVDFNGCLDARGFSQFIEFMPLRTYQHLDLIEDPFPYHSELWQQAQQRWKVRLALDKGWRDGEAGFSAVVVKPARRDWRAVAARHPEKPLVLTSAMDHGLGQMFAAYEAAVAKSEIGDRVDLCGLSTQHLFEPDGFFERISAKGGWLSHDTNGGGLGFGDVLEKLPWRKLSSL